MTKARPQGRQLNLREILEMDKDEDVKDEGVMGRRGGDRAFHR